MRHTNIAFCRPVNEPCRPPPNPIGHDTRQWRSMRPRVGISMPPISRKRVDFPAPLRPTSPTLSRGGIVKVTPFKTHLPGPCSVLYRLCTSSATIIAPQASVHIEYAVRAQDTWSPWHRSGRIRDLPLKRHGIGFAGKTRLGLFRFHEPAGSAVTTLDRPAIGQ